LEIPGGAIGLKARYRCRKRGVKQKDQSEAQRTFDRRTGEPNESLSDAAPIALPLTGYRQRWIFVANQPYCAKR
jgi:hypothetical protein